MREGLGYELSSFFLKAFRFEGGFVRRTLLSSFAQREGLLMLGNHSVFRCWFLGGFSSNFLFLHVGVDYVWLMASGNMEMDIEWSGLG